MKREFSSGGVVFKKNGGVFWLIIKPRPSKLFPNERYQLPKGHVREGESTEAAAVREVLEETGVKAKIIRKVGSNKFPLKIGDEKIFKIVTYYLMEYLSGELTVNDEVEELFWLSFDEARKKLTFYDDKKILDLAAGGPSSDSTPGNFESGGFD